MIDPQLFDELYKKRFIVSNNSDEIYCCEVGRFYHIACCIDKNINTKTVRIHTQEILSYGINHYQPTTITRTIHAEVDALNKLPFSRKKRKINILILRLTKKDKNLCMSRPCQSCLNTMAYLLPKKGYIIKNVYYSNANGTIEKTTLSKLYEQQNCKKTKYNKFNYYDNKEEDEEEATAIKD